MLGRDMYYGFQQFLIYLKTMFMPHKERRKTRKHALEKLIVEKKSKVKWGVSYSVFDGEELLEGSIRSIRKSVDYVNVVYQVKSWYGNPASENLVPFLLKLKKEGLIDELIEYHPNINIKAGKQEAFKRNIGLQAAKKAKVDYFMTMDCDEYYEEKELEDAKNFILLNKITNSYCLQFKYAYLPTQRNINPIAFVGLFFKLHRDSKIGKDKNLPILIDPTRVVVTKYSKKYYVLRTIKVHHYELVRKNLLKKIENSSFTGEFKYPDEKNDLVKVDNIFSIDIEKFTC